MGDWKNWLASLLLHGMVAGAMAVMGLSHLAPEQDTGSVPIYFEVIEAAAMNVAESDSGSVPNEDSGPVPIQEDVAEGSVPIENTGPVHIQEDDITPEYELNTSESSNIGDWQNEEQARPQELEAVGGEDTPADEGELPQEESENLAVAQDERARIVSDPIALNRIVPVYPRSARRKGHEGRVTVEISVAEDGGIASAEVVDSSGHAELDAAALGAVRTARFAPATEDGVSVSGRLRLTFDFRLR